MSSEIKTKRSELRIQVTDSITRQLVDEFKITTQHVRNCLCFFSDSKLAKEVRKKAIEKMERVMAENEILMNDFQ